MFTKAARGILENKSLVLLAGAATLLAFVLMGSLTGSAHQDPINCNASGLQQFPAISPSGNVQDGDVITYTVIYSNTDPDGAGPVAPCNITGANATIDLPGAAPVINVLTGATINVGQSISCPGGAGCAAGPYTYTVQHSDETTSSVTAVFDIIGILHQDADEETASDHDTLSKTVIHAPNIVTHVHNASHADITNSSTTVGSLIHDNVMVTDPNAQATVAGNVNFRLFNSGNCEGTVLASTTVALAAGAAETAPTSTLAMGSYSFLAHYLGSSQFTEATATCEPFSLNKLDSQTATQVHNPQHQDVTNTSVQAGTMVHDRAAVTGSGPTPTGNVEFQRFNNINCSGTAGNNEIVALAGGVAESSAFAPATGSWSFKVIYNGDPVYNGSQASCEPFTVIQNQTRTATQVHNATHQDITGQTVPFGTAIHDMATVTGATTTPTGAATFNLIAGTNCDGPTIASQVVALNAQGTAESNATSTLAVGNYGFLVTYGGDTANMGSNASCEPFAIDKLPSNVATQVHNSTHQDITGQTLQFGTAIHDMATVTGGSVMPTGNVTFNLISGTNCAGQTIWSQVVGLNAQGTAESNATSTLAAGNYGFLVSYGGDSAHATSTASCEPFTIQQVALQYCSPGYWKQSQHFDSWVNYLPSNSFFTIFGRHITIMWSAKGKPASLTDPTLLQALEANGGGTSMFARVAVDGLLNSTSMNSGFTPAQVISMVQGAIDSGDYQSVASQLTPPENCPLN